MEAPSSITVDSSCDYTNGGDELAIKTTPRRRRGYIPYSTIYEKQEEVRKNGYWIPGLQVEATIVHVRRDVSSNYHILNPFIYTIELEHGRYKWRTIKRYKDFSALSSRLLAHRTAERIKAPVRRARNRLEEVIEGNDGEDEEEKQDKARSPTDSSTLHVLSKDPEIDEYNEDGLLPDSTWDEFKADDSKMDDELTMSSMPYFPMVPDSMIADDHMQERSQKLEKWLRAVLRIPINREYHETAEFLDVSRYSFINELGGKYKEGKTKKRPGGNKVYIGCKQFCVRWLLPWSKRWLMVKDTYVSYVNPSNEEIRLVLLFDEQFEVNSHELAVNLRPKEMVLSNLQHVLDLRCHSEEDTDDWIDTIKHVLEETGQIWLHKKRYGSSFPQRLNSYCQWFVDAKDCWEKAASLIEMAREEIFIADWWLSPEIFLRRPMAEGNYWRLDYALKRRAEKGIRIFILVYKEMEMALGLKSLYSKKHLQGLHPNIKVIRHPDHYLGSGTFFWAHHEKLLIIDQLVAFVGGIDFCYGRWDDRRHMLTDLGSVVFEPRSEQVVMEPIPVDTKTKVTADGDNLQKVHRLTEDIIDGGTGRKIGEKTTETISKPPENETISKPKEPSLTTPIQQKLKGVMQRTVDRVRAGRRESDDSKDTPAKPIQRQRHSADGMENTEIFVENGKPMEHQTTDILDTTEGSSSNEGQSKTVSKGMTTPTSQVMMEPKQSTLIRRALNNLKPEKARRRWRLAMHPSEETADEYIVNYCRLQETKVDMSGLQGAGKLWPGKDYVNFVHKDFVDVDLAFNDFINRYDTPRMPWHDIHSRWNAAKTEKLKSDSRYPYLLPKSYNSIRVPRVLFGDNTHRVEVQVLRSCSHWSSLIDKTEDSIQQAYLSLIANARHYVYIENQFFVSMINNADVNNEICRVLCDRIIRAYREKETFRVFVLIPLLPGFEGDIGATSYSALLAVLHWTMLSISKGDHSLIQNLQRAGVENVQKYISFCSLRTYSQLYGKLVTELVYIHSKLMIVDDMHTIIGSANINDRSQAGNRDSEVCLLITDHEFVDGRMDGKAFRAGKFASSLRTRLMREHLGLLEDSLPKTSPGKAAEIDVTDPICPTFYEDHWCQIAASNTRIYEEVFRGYPTNLVKTFEELAIWRAEKTMAEEEPEKARQRLAELVGLLVEFPINFLRRENLSPTFASKEGLVPTSVFT
uniref:Phospholipase n=1 Tax=Globodera rostochiensis TaxID=31243 RepID=A0A914HQS8_GLORO